MSNSNHYEGLIRENLDNIRIWRSDGLSANQISRKLNISKNTLYLYMRTIPELNDAWDAANHKLIKEKLEPALLQQALNGMPYVETTEELVGGEMITTKRVHKVVYSPAILKWVLSQLDPAKWGSQTLKDDNKLDLSPNMTKYGI